MSEKVYRVRFRVTSEEIWEVQAKDEADALAWVAKWGERYRPPRPVRCVGEVIEKPVIISVEVL